MTALATNTIMLPAANVVVNGTGADRTLALTPASGQTGSSSITVSVSDGQNVTTASFDLTVLGVGRIQTVTRAPGGLATIQLEGNPGQLFRLMS